VFDKAHEQTGDEACATARPSSPAAASAGSAGMVWRKPTYIELPMPKKRAPRNSGTAWPAAERKRLGLTQPEFARRAGIRREYLSTIEQGRRNPSADILARLEAALRSITANGD
jgi:DNA-binding XRE family transcriptional regulator